MRRAGVSLIEVLILIGAMVVLLALLLPAVQRVREVASSAQCKLNLRTIHAAVLEYTLAHQAFPYGGCGQASRTQSWMYHDNPLAPELPSTGFRQNWGWPYQILPYLGYEAQWKRPTYTTDGKPAALTFEEPVKIYFCPSRSRFQRVLREGWGFAAIDYAGNGGHLSFVDPNTGAAREDNTVANPYPLTLVHRQHTGIIGAGRSYRYGMGPIDPPLKPAAIEDGAANTILIAEKRLNVVLARMPTLLPGTTKPQPGDELGYCSGFSTDTIRTGAYVPARDERNVAKVVVDGFGSSHYSGFHALFADGSVRTLRFGWPEGMVQGGPA